MASPTAVRQGNPGVKWGLRALVVAYLFFLVAWPTSLVVKETFPTVCRASPRRSTTPTSCTRCS